MRRGAAICIALALIASVAEVAVALALAVGDSLGRDLGRISTVACAVAEGDLGVRTGVRRRDEVGLLAMAVDEMIEQLAASEEERKILIASVGHDLRTPLASLTDMTYSFRPSGPAEKV